MMTPSVAGSCAVWLYYLARTGQAMASLPRVQTDALWGGLQFELYWRAWREAC